MLCGVAQKKRKIKINKKKVTIKINVLVKRATFLLYPLCRIISQTMTSNYIQSPFRIHFNKFYICLFLSNIPVLFITQDLQRQAGTLETEAVLHCSGLHAISGPAFLVV